MMLKEGKKQKFHCVYFPYFSKFFLRGAQAKREVARTSAVALAGGGPAPACTRRSRRRKHIFEHEGQFLEGVAVLFAMAVVLPLYF
jgi:hypothetical protein